MEIEHYKHSADDMYDCLATAPAFPVIFTFCSTSVHDQMVQFSLTDLIIVCLHGLCTMPIG